MWTPAPKKAIRSDDEIDTQAKARRDERKRMRTNLGVKYRYDADRPDVEEQGYESSDIDEDIQATVKKYKEIQTTLKKYKDNNKSSTPETEDREQRKAKRQRLAKKAEMIKETLGSGKIVTDAIYFTNVKEH